MIPNQKRKWDPLSVEIMSVDGVPDAEGKILRVTETLYHSCVDGYHLQTRIFQTRKNGIWETAELGEYEYPDYPRQHRLLKVCRQMTPEQVMRFVVDAYMPEEEGVRSEVHRLLDQSGIQGFHAGASITDVPLTGKSTLGDE